MKRTILLFFAIAGILSCTENDTIPKTKVDPIIGTWQVQSVFEDGVDFATECNKKSTAKFSERGDLTLEMFSDRQPAIDSCFIKNEIGSWQNNDGIYEIKLDGDDCDWDDADVSIILSEDFNTLNFIDPEDTSYYIVFKKI
jgi:hypothetical protein